MPEAPTKLYRVEFYEENRPGTVRTEYTQARDTKEAKRFVKQRGFILDRQNGDASLLHLFYRDDVLIVAHEEMRKPKMMPPEKTPDEIYMATGSCPLCGYKVEDDYCQSCGWQRTATWWGRIKTLENFALGKRAWNNRGDIQ